MGYIKLKGFTAPTALPSLVLVGGLGQGGAMDTFAARFGDRLRRVPGTRRMIAAKDKEDQCVLFSEDGIQIGVAITTAAHFADWFKLNAEPDFEVSYYELPDGHKYWATFLIKVLRGKGLWRD